MDRERPEMYQALGRTIQVLRTDQGLDRKDLAERAGISYSYLAAIETGNKPPSSKVLFAIAEALGLRSHELMGAAESRHDRHHGSSPSRPGAWFHSKPAPPTVRTAAYAPAPEVDAMLEDREDLPMNRNLPRSPAGYLMELERLTAGLSDRDREMILDLARRLAARER
ncbi:MAG: helix-turn-helix domain-containing protein [Actinobacteria bacterium]|nr:helix-turn-helix domain-containing protein [Actinomycetota bacterium]MBU1494667.1 helix-turn-helix domain-containing protein [Actinomycetota bacterium]MBU1866547.1 helix-turn-helix domain-containing protein [Actinomycetota bacterium]